MRCGRPFWWWRRRHHCRLCGRCVCGNCSGKTFYIAEGTKNGDHRAARACEQCYETVFPIMDGTPSIPSSSIRAGGGTTNSLSEFPEWRSVRISNVGEDVLASSASSALLAVDLGPQREPSHADRESSLDGPGLSYSPSPRVRIRPPSRPRSYLQILENFNEGSPSGSGFTTGQRSNLEVPSADVNNSIGASISAGASGYLSTSVSTSCEFSPESAEPTEDVLKSSTIQEFSPPPRVRWSLPVSPKRREDTIRKKKRFSVPAFAIQTTTVTARTNANGVGESKRFSLILGGRGSSSQPNLTGGRLGAGIAEEEGGDGEGNGSRNSAAVGKLSELLTRNSGNPHC